MPAFQYTAYDRRGRRKRGVVEARDMQEAVRRLKEQGFVVGRIAPREASVWTREIRLTRPRVRRPELIIFCRQLATLIRAGIPLADALAVLQQQTESRTLRAVLARVLEDVRGGTAFSAACRVHGSAFPELFVSMVRAGEATGNLDEVLEQLALFYEKEQAAFEKVKSALIYPAIVLVTAVLVTAFLMWKVVPQFVATYRSIGLELPWLTRLLISVSTGAAYHVHLGVGVPLAVAVCGVLSYRTARGRVFFDRLRLRLPIYGPLAKKSMLARFCRTFSMLYAAAVPLLEALTLVGRVVQNAALAQVVEEAKTAMQEGRALADPFRRSRLIPPMVAHMIAVGEETGALDELLGKVAAYYEDEVAQAAERLKSSIEPLLILLVAALVGMVVLSVLLPAFQLYRTL